MRPVAVVVALLITIALYALVVSVALVLFATGG